MPGPRRPGPPPTSPPRRRNAAATRERILAAAKARFTESNFSDVTIRDIATDAEIDPALVARYFGNKHRLYLEALTPSLQLDQVDQADVVTLLTARLLDRLDGQGRRLFTIATTEPAGSPAHDALRQLLDEQLLEPLTRRIADADGADGDIEAARLRTELAVGVVAGVAFLRSVLGSRALSGVSNPELVDQLVPLMTVLLGRPDQPDGG